MQHMAHGKQLSTCSMRHAAWASCGICHAACGMRHAACGMQHTTPNIQHASYSRRSDGLVDRSIDPHLFNVSSLEHAKAFEWSTLMGCLPKSSIESDRKRVLSGRRCSVSPASVNLVIMDSTSRISFLLQAATTRPWLEDLGSSSSDHAVLHYDRFNSIGWSTAPNVNALMAACPPTYACETGGARECDLAKAISFPPLREGCGEPLAPLYQSHGYVTVLNRQGWPNSHEVEGFDHYVDLETSWLGHLHTCRSNGECGNKGSPGDWAPYFPSSGVPSQSCFGDYHIHHHMLKYVDSASSTTTFRYSRCCTCSSTKTSSKTALTGWMSNCSGF